MHSEIGEMLLGLKRRFELLNVDNPWAVVVDNCCHFRNMIVNVFPEVAVLQDVWHVIMRYTFFFTHVSSILQPYHLCRYMVCVLGGTKNPHRAEVAEDISSAIIKVKAHDGIPARYWTKEEQEERLVMAFEKWDTVGGVWSAAAEKVHLCLDFLSSTAPDCQRPHDPSSRLTKGSLSTFERGALPVHART